MKGGKVNKEKKSRKDVYILWVRHCQSCSNVGSIFSYRKHFIPPLCTKKGIVQSVLFGKRLKRKLSEIYKKLDLLDIKFYSSYLPRAMLTVKLITNSFLEMAVSNERKEIHRIPYIAEHHNLIDKICSNTQSSISSNTSNRYALALNKLFPNTYPIVVQKKGDNKQIKKSYRDYYKFMTEILPGLDSGSLHVMAAHGNFIRVDVMDHINSKWSDKKYHPKNLDSILVRYRDGVPKLIKSRFDSLVYLSGNDVEKYNEDKIVMPLISKEYEKEFRERVVSCKYKDKEIK